MPRALPDVAVGREIALAAIRSEFAMKRRPAMFEKTTAAKLFLRGLMMLGFLMAAPLRVSAQATPMTLGYDFVLNFVTPGINDALANNKELKDEDLRWGDEPHIQVGPRDSSFGNNQVVIRLNLARDSTFLQIDTAITVLMSFNLLCTNGNVTVLYAGSSGTTDLPDWVNRFFVGPISVPASATADLLKMVNSTVSALGACGSVNAWDEGIVIFPPDQLDPYMPSPLVSKCTDSTTGRSGAVLIDGGEIVASISPGTDSRWPDQKAGLRVWVSPDGSEANGVELYQALGTTDPQHLYETDPGQGAAGVFPLPAGMSYVACDMNPDW
jgi:hypothetical protein